MGNRNKLGYKSVSDLQSKVLRTNALKKVEIRIEKVLHTGN